MKRISVVTFQNDHFLFFFSKYCNRLRMINFDEDVGFGRERSSGISSGKLFNVPDCAV